MLKVNITNQSLKSLMEHWGISAEQNAYLDELLADEEIWKEILGTTELSRIAYAEIGNGAEKYKGWYGETDGDDSCIFVSYCLYRAGCISEAFINKSDNCANLR